MMGRHADDSRHKPYEIEQLWDIHHEVMRLALIGMKQVDIANHLSITPAMVTYTLRSSLVKRQMAEMHAARDLEAVDVSAEIHRLAPKAVAVLETLLDNSLPNIKLKAATDILDRAGHAAVRTIKTENIHAHFTSNEIEEIKQRAKEVGLVIDIECDSQVANLPMVASGG